MTPAKTFYDINSTVLRALTNPKITKVMEVSLAFLPPILVGYQLVAIVVAKRQKRIMNRQL